MTLSDLYKKNLDDDEDGEDFVEEGEEEEVIIFIAKNSYSSVISRFNFELELVFKWLIIT